MKRTLTDEQINRCQEVKIMVCVVYKHRPNVVERTFVNQSVVECNPVTREFAEEYILHHETFFVQKVVDDIVLFYILDFDFTTFCEHQCVLFQRTAAGASNDFDVRVDGEHVFLSSPLVYDYEPVGVAFVCVSERLYVLLGVYRRAVA